MTPEDLQQIGAIVQAAEERINARIANLGSAVAEQHAATVRDLRTEIGQVEERLNARIEHVETSLLTEFHKWASRSKCA